MLGPFTQNNSNK